MINELALSDIRHAAGRLAAAPWPGAEAAVEVADVALSLADQSAALTSDMSPESDGMINCLEVGSISMTMLSLARFCRMHRQGDVVGAQRALVSYWFWVRTWSGSLDRQISARLRK